jgi:hypothetical protein
MIYVYARPTRKREIVDVVTAVSPYFGGFHDLVGEYQPTIKPPNWRQAHLNTMMDDLSASAEAQLPMLPFISVCDPCDKRHI